ncbi:MAG: hypothetical protein HY901_09150 [Deltaproteobacteria bacterium]|nr:hypothetical protein [Deltaproteobacteria bacterium]
MPFVREKLPWWRLLGRFCLRLLKLFLKTVFVLLLIVIPVPVGFMKPHIPKPDRRNQPTQVARKD